MVHPRLLCAALTAFVLLSSIHTHAQQSNSTATKNESADAALREKAFDLLDSLAGQLSTLQSAENRARIGSNLAESLWEHDEKRARALLVLVEDDIKAKLEAAESNDPKYAHTLMVFLKLRMDTVERIAKHDAEAALAFLKATEINSEKKLPFGVAENQRMLELRLASQMVADQPEVALQLARKSLSQNLSSQLLLVLRRLNRKHKDEARLLHREMVRKLEDANLVQDEEAREFAEDLVRTFVPPAAEESTYRQLIAMFITRALEHGCGKKLSEEDQGAWFCQWVGAAVPQMENFDQARSARLKQWIPVAEAEAFPIAVFNELNDATDFGTVDELLALATKYPDLAEEVQSRALGKAMASGDMERARKIAADYKGDRETRRFMLERLDGQTTPETDVFREYTQAGRNETGSLFEQSRLLLRLANRLHSKDRNAALKLLKQVSDLVETMPPGKEETEAKLGLAMMYCLDKNDQGLTIMEALVPKLNTLVDAAAKLDGYDTAYLCDGEWNMSGEGSVGNLLTQLARTAGYFAWCDFDRSVSLAGQFERAEIRIMAQLKLAQAILAGRPTGLPAL
jgi:hypothetical protein